MGEDGRMSDTATQTSQAAKPAPSDEPLLAVEDLQTYFFTDEGTVRAVDGVTFDIRPGESLGIVGESGSGKSVTMISLMGLIPSPPGEIVGGEARFKGEDLFEKSDRHMRKIRGNEISMIWQDPMSSLNPFLRISTQLYEPLKLHQGLTETEARERAIDMLEKVGIPGAEDRIDEYPHQFSGGMRQRVMIAMALLCEPDLLIADEPTTALDVTIQAQILELIKDLREDFGTSVITITHDLGVVAGMAERIIVMYAGRVMEEAPADELFYQPSHPYTVGLLKSVPRLDRGGEEELIPIEGLPPDTSEEISGCPFAERCRWKIDKCEDEFPPPVDFGHQHRSYCWRAEEVYNAELGTKTSPERMKEIERRVAAGETIEPYDEDEGGDDE
jgi:oligopeptide transport system ATP-binding protein